MKLCDNRIVTVCFNVRYKRLNCWSNDGRIKKGVEKNSAQYEHSHGFIYLVHATFYLNAVAPNCLWSGAEYMIMPDERRSIHVTRTKRGQTPQNTADSLTAPIELQSQSPFCNTETRPKLQGTLIDSRVLTPNIAQGGGFQFTTLLMDKTPPQTTSVPRRKMRKGTHSCIECKILYNKFTKLRTPVHRLLEPRMERLNTAVERNDEMFSSICLQEYATVCSDSNCRPTKEDPM
jgi:hypothetical protein